jgi:hypothetical protein
MTQFNIRPPFQPLKLRLVRRQGRLPPRISYGKGYYQVFRPKLKAPSTRPIGN